MGEKFKILLKNKANLLKESKPGVKIAKLHIYGENLQNDKKL